VFADFQWFPSIHVQKKMLSDPHLRQELSIFDAGFLAKLADSCFFERLP
jgi:hypothetical protein